MGAERRHIPKSHIVAGIDEAVLAIALDGRAIWCGRRRQVGFDRSACDKRASNRIALFLEGQEPE